MLKFNNLDDETGEPILTRHQLQWIICDKCRGEGKHDHPAFSNGITSDEWNDWNEDEREDYLEGRYDVPCDDCGGKGRQQIPIVSACSFAQKRKLVEYRKSERESYRDWKSEQRLRDAEDGVWHGCGYY